MLKTAMENNTLYEPKKIVESCAMRNSDSDSNQESLQNKKFTVHDNISYLKSWFLCWKNLKDFWIFKWMDTSHKYQTAVTRKLTGCNNKEYLLIVTSQRSNQKNSTITNKQVMKDENSWLML